MTLKELEEQKRKCEAELRELQKRADELHKEYVEAKRDEVAKTTRLIRKNKDLIFSLLEHDRDSCSDDNPCNSVTNGYGVARCRKCQLMEILNCDWLDGDYDIRFEVSIEPVK